MKKYKTFLGERKSVSMKDAVAQSDKDLDKAYKHKKMMGAKRKGNSISRRKLNRYVRKTIMERK